MCQNCQATFGEIVGLEPVVPVAPHRDDTVECADSGNNVAITETFQDSDGNYYEYEDSLTCCPDCDRVVTCDELDENDGYCQRCRERNYTACSCCRAIVNNRDCRTSEGGSDYCDSCYWDYYTTCDDCGEEMSRDDAVVRRGGCYCDGCAGHDEEGEKDAERGWVGGSGYAKVGSRRRFGVELETSNSEGWTSWIDNTVFGAKHDGSVNGKEFVSPILYGDDGLHAIEDLCDRATRNGCEVDDACGYHLHIDMGDTSSEERKRIALAYAYTRELWFQFVDHSRRDNTYCHSNVIGNSVYWDVDTIKDGSDHPRINTRYVWLNWVAYNAHKTLEVRLHEGTLDGRAVCNWVAAHIKFVEYVKGLTIGQITRIFGNKTLEAQMRNMRDIWRGTELGDYYARKAGIGQEVCAA